MDLSCEGCARKNVTRLRRGRCDRCYLKLVTELRKEGNFTPIPRSEYSKPSKPRVIVPPVDRVLRKVTAGADGCWLYSGRLDRHGYGAACEYPNRPALAHRVVYAAMVGPIPAGAELDHLCHSRDTSCPGGATCIHRRCVNPAHLEPVTGTENNLRSNSPSAINKRKTHCIHGHAFTPKNTQWKFRNGRKKGWERRCIQCRRNHPRNKQKESS